MELFALGFLTGVFVIGILGLYLIYKVIRGDL
jgi:hypothetical protein